MKQWSDSEENNILCSQVLERAYPEILEALPFKTSNTIKEHNNLIWYNAI